MDEHAVCGRSQSVSSLASPFGAAIDLARAGQLPSLPGLGPSPGSGPGTSLPPKPRGIERRAATDMLPNIHTGKCLPDLDSRASALQGALSCTCLGP